VDWPACRSVTEAKSFIGLRVYYRLWIAEFPLVGEPIFRLFRRATLTTKHSKKKKTALVEFVWGSERRKAMEQLKTALVMALALKPIVYTHDSEGFLG
jgi:hypothetical protein